MQPCLVPLLSDWGLGKNGGRLLPTSNAHCRYPSSVLYHILPIFDANNIVLSAPNIGRSLFELSVPFMSAIYTEVDNPCPSDLFAPVHVPVPVTDHRSFCGWSTYCLLREFFAGTTGIPFGKPSQLARYRWVDHPLCRWAGWYRL